MSATQMMKFEERLARAALAVWERALLDLARAIARRDGTIDMHVLASRSGNPLHLVRRRRAKLEARGLWPWLTDKSRVGPPRKEIPARSVKETERRKREIRDAWLAIQAERRDVEADAAASCAAEPASLREICKTYLDEFRHLRDRAHETPAARPTVIKAVHATETCREKSTHTSS